jgi:hypothetical protein
MLPELSLFIQHAVAQADVPAPQTFKRLAHSRGRRVDNDLPLTVSEVGQESADVESDHKLNVIMIELIATGLRKNSFRNQPRMKFDCQSPCLHGRVSFG